MTVAGSEQPIRVSSADFSVATNAATPPDLSRRHLQASQPTTSALVGSDGAIVEMKQAKVEVPLFVIQAMSADQLSRINSITITITAR